MRYAILSDIHSNWEALQAVLADIKRQKVKSSICLGDIVGYGPNPVECLERMQKLNIPTVRGNHDHHAAQRKLPDWFSPVARAGLIYSRSLLTREHKKYLASLPLKLKIDGLEFVHASLNKPSTWRYILEGEEADEHFLVQKSGVSFCGHTHQPCVWQHAQRVCHRGAGVVPLNADDQYLVNVGSVGLPRDGDPRACYVVYDSEAREVMFRRVDYAVAKTRDKIIAVGLPVELAARLL